MLQFKNKIKITISSIYNESNKRGDWKSLEEHLDKYHKNTISIIGGDLNEHLNEQSNCLSKLEEMGLYNAAELFDKQAEITWSVRGSKTIVDYIWISPALAEKTWNTEVKEVDDFFNTDYKAVTTTIRMDTFTSQVRQERKKVKRWIFDIKKRT